MKNAKYKKIAGAALVLPIISSYFTFMFIFPFCEGGINLLRATLLQWQTLNAGMVALVAAAITAAVTMKTDKAAWERQHKALNYQKNLEEERRLREYKAAKALLSSSLSPLSDYVESCVEELILTYFQCSPTEDNNGVLEELSCRIDKIPVPKEHENIFYDCIKLASNSENEKSNYLAMLLSELQILTSRIGGIKSDHFKIRNLKYLIIQSVYIELMISGLYDYARGNGGITYPFREASNFHNRLASNKLGYQYMNDDPAFEEIVNFYVRMNNPNLPSA